MEILLRTSNKQQATSNKQQDNSHPDTLYAKLFARFYNPLMGDFESGHLYEKRRELLRDLKGDVLDIGIGTGANFPAYPSTAKVVACEPSQAMLKYAARFIEKRKFEASIQLVHAGVGDEILEDYVPSEGLDAIVCTLVLCTISDPAAAIDRFRKWLKPSGKLYILEHIHAEIQPMKALQTMFNPLWNLFSQGCQLNRRTDLLLKEKGFVPVQEKLYNKSLPFYQAVMVVGNMNNYTSKIFNR